MVPVATDSGRYWGRRAFQKRPGTIHVMVRPALPANLRRGELMAQLEQALRLDGPMSRRTDISVENSVGSIATGR